jgi:regulatory protein
MKITKIAAAVKTAGRYNVFVDDKFSFSLDETQLVKLGLRKGDEISAERLAELKAESDFGKNYIRAVDLISRRLRSEKEIRDYAWRKQWAKENLDKVIERLGERGYLNDAKFAASFVRSRATLRNYSTRKMKLELRKKGVAPEIIEKVLAESEEFDEAAALKNLVAKKRAHYAGDEQKFIAYLARQGFPYDEIKAALKEQI